MTGGEEKPSRNTDFAAGFPVFRQDKSVSSDIDVFSQARKVLSERSPYDAVDDGSAPSTVATLPSGLANLLKQSDSRKRRKKSHSCAEAKPKGSNIWVEAEEYFRDLSLPDIDVLSELSSLGSIGGKSYFLIPHLGSESVVNASHTETGSCGENGNAKANVDVARAGVVQENGKLMEIDDAGVDVKHEEDTNVKHGEVIDEKIEEESRCSVSGSGTDSSVGLEWLLGCRNKVYLTSERPSKKRKLLGGDAGLEKVMVPCPSKRDSLLCDYCCRGNEGNGSNPLLTCSSCKATVHQLCYGLQEAGNGSWSCSWCRRENNSSESGNPCLLCPKQGGALKPVYNDTNRGGTEFAHLFCSQWMPEVYVEDLTRMEPVMNLGGIKDTRRKLICNICKVKYGACVRCSHGSCRTSFHPICSREAGHRMEIWAKYGFDDVELRAFCYKHSGVHGRSGIHVVESRSVGSDYPVPSSIPAITIDKSHKIGFSTGDKMETSTGTPDTRSDNSGNSSSQGVVSSDAPSSARLISDIGNAFQPISMEKLDRNRSGNGSEAESLDFLLILRKLIDRGRINAKDVASQIGVTPDFLTTTLAEDSMAPDLQRKLFQWFKNHAYMGVSQKNLKVKLKSATSWKDELGVSDDSDELTVSESDAPDVKSVPPRRRTKSNVRILKDKKVVSSSTENPVENGTKVNEINLGQLFGKEHHCTSKTSPSDGVRKKSTQADGAHDYVPWGSPDSKGNLPKAANCCLSDRVPSQKATIPECTLVKKDDESFACLVVNPAVPDVTRSDDVPRFYLHPYIRELWRKQSFEDGAIFPLELSSNGGIFCSNQFQHPCREHSDTAKGSELDQLVKAREMGVLDISPEDEVEGEIIYFQHKLLGNAVARKRLAENLVSKIVERLPHEIETARAQRWDVVLVNQYLYDLKEAKKQGRKEKRHKEAQAVLAAATAAAAASTRTSASRKDSFEESAHQEKLKKLNTNNGRAGFFSQSVPRAKESLSRVAAPRVSLEKYSDVDSVSNYSKEHPRECDICRRPETILNPVLLCSGCKVTVHLDCYHSVKETTGRWYCEPCEQILSSRSAGASAGGFCEKPYFSAECGLCGGTTGAFRKTTNGQWVHSFCAEWVFESTFRRGQANPVEGMDMVSKGSDSCCICKCNFGVCIKCHYGRCQTKFHPSCARSAGLFMNVKAVGGKLQHKAYCEKHGLDQRAKAKSQKHGLEELKNAKQIRVELERLRLLCERIVKREKIKRDIVICTHEILAAKRDDVRCSALLSGNLFHPEISSESATTSLKGQTDDYKLCSEAIQKSDDVSVDSRASVKHQTLVQGCMDADQKTDDSSTSQHMQTKVPAQRIPLSGKKIPCRPNLTSSSSPADDRERVANSRKHPAAFEKELIMTSDQASMKNQLLPKGYIYVPLKSLPKEKQMKPDGSSDG